MRLKTDSKTTDLFGKPTAQDRYDARQRAAAYWMPIIRAMLS
jgi:hypothetical protein